MSNIKNELCVLMRYNATRHKIKGLLFQFASVLINSDGDKRRVTGDSIFQKCNFKNTFLFQFLLPHG